MEHRRGTPFDPTTASFPHHSGIAHTFGNARHILAPFLAVLYLIAGNAVGTEIAGWVEQAQLQPSGIDLKAKLDTGARHTSVNALAVETFERGGREHVRFRVKNKAGKTVELELPVLRHATIKRHFGTAQTRPVVELTICIGNVSKAAEINLVDRAGFNYPLLLGRSYLAGEFIIDSSATFKLGPHCTAGTGR